MAEARTPLMSDLPIVEKLRAKDPYLIPYLLGWAGKGIEWSEPKPEQRAA